MMPWVTSGTLSLRATTQPVNSEYSLTITSARQSWASSSTWSIEDRSGTSANPKNVELRDPEEARGGWPTVRS
jgi:hypothetical protein